METDWEKMPARGRELRSDEEERREEKELRRRKKGILKDEKDGEGDMAGVWEKGREKRQS